MAAVKTEAQYKQYFTGSFKGMDSIIDDVLSPIFGEFTWKTSPTDKDYVDDYGTGGANIYHIYDYGTFYTDKIDVSVFEVILADKCHISISRKKIQNTVRQITKTYSGAFIVFHYPDGSTNAEAQTWRLSWLKRLDVHRKDSPAKRYTYLCGPSYSCRTIAKRFDVLFKEPNKTLSSITAAFDVESLSKDFFFEYKVFYDDIIQWITGTRYVGDKKSERIDNKAKSTKDLYTPFANKCNEVNKKEWNSWDDKKKNEKIEKFIRDWVKKLMGRLVFIQFIQKKGWLGISDKVSDWKGGDENFLLNRFYDCYKRGENFLKNELYAILFDSLNKSACKDGGGVEITKRDGIKYPFLNGGLFEEEPADTLHIELPNELFHNEDKKDISRSIGKKGYRQNEKEFLEYCGLLDFFGHYNFTIDENASEDEESEVGIDPEMLSKVFENLLEDNKEKGAFYTPKEIVQYMSKESLISYLCAEIKGIDKEIRGFVETQVIDKKLLKQKVEILNALHNVKICDPAVGSGAFPMGLLNLILKLRLVLDDDADCNETYNYSKLMETLKASQAEDNEICKVPEYVQLARIKCAIKKSIIQNNIYGVDIEKGAVDLARLRFWLNIVVDEDKPTPLPNLDFKIRQGNSLLECYEGIDLSKLAAMRIRRNCEVQCDLFGNIEGVDKEALYVGDKFARFDLQKEMDGFIDISDPAKKKEIRQRIEEYIHCALCNTLLVRKLEIQAGIDKFKCLPQLNNRQQKELNKKESEEKALDAAIENLQSVVNDKFFLWHTWFADVFEKGGFDIVIGNPPYFNIQTLGAHSPYAEAVMKTYSDIWQDKSDILFYFFRLALDLSNSIICYITSNAYLFSDKAKKLRNKLLEDGRLNRIVNFEEFMVFNDADITTCITLMSKKTCDFSAVSVKGSNYTLKTLLEYIQNPTNSYLVKLKEDSVFALVEASIDTLNARIDGEHEKLNNLVIIGKGMETAADPVFLFEEYPSQFPSECVKIRVTGENMDKYVIYPDHKYVLYFEDFDSFKDLPESVQNHLNSNKLVLSERATVKNEGRVWWRYSRPMHKEYYHLSKLFCSRRAFNNVFCYDDAFEYLSFSNMTVIFDTNETYPIKYILALLNSSVLNFRYKSIGKQTGKGSFEFFPNGVGKLPIPFASGDSQKQIISIVDRILAAKKVNPQADTSALERKIDVLVYLLYGLTWNEVQVVENSSVHAALPVNEVAYTKWLERYQKYGTLPSEEEMEKAMNKPSNQGPSVVPVTSGPSIVKVTYQSPYESFGPNYGLEIEYNYDTDDLQYSICGRGDSTKTLTPAQIKSLKAYLKDRRNIEEFFSKAKSTAPNTNFTHFRSHDMSMEYGDRSKSVENGELMPWAEPFAKLC